MHGILRVEVLLPTRWPVAIHMAWNVPPLKRHAQTRTDPLGIPIDPFRKNP